MTADSFTPLHARTTTNAVFLYLFFLQSCWPVPQLNLVLFSLCCNVAIFFTLLAVELSTTEHGCGQFAVDINTSTRRYPQLWYGVKNIACIVGFSGKQANTGNDEDRCRTNKKSESTYLWHGRCLWASPGYTAKTVRGL